MQSRRSSVGKAMGYGLDGPGIGVQFPAGVRDFSLQSPDRLWGPRNLLSNGYRGLFSPGDIAARI
jgi:hypothetical protein